MTNYGKFFAALVGAILTTVSQLFGVSIDMDPGVISTIGGAVTALLVFVVPNIDEKGDNAARRVDAAIRRLQAAVSQLPTRGQSET